MTRRRYGYDNRPLVAVEAEPPFKERIRRMFGLRPREYIKYVPAVGYGGSQYQNPYQSAYYGNYSGYPSQSPYYGNGIRPHSTGGSGRIRAQYSGYSGYQNGYGTSYRRSKAKSWRY